MMRFIQIFFGLFLFTFPFSLRFLVYEESAYRFGQFNPWVSEFVYVPEVLLVIAFGLWVIGKQGYKEILRRLRQAQAPQNDIGVWVLLILFALNILILTTGQGDVMPSLFFIWRLVEIGMLYLLITHKVLAVPVMVRILIGGAFFQVVLALIQWKLNHSIGLVWLGEPVIGPDILNVAKTDLPNGLKHIRPYGTLLHPNILAGYLLVLFFIALDYLKGRQRRLLWFLLIALGLWFTQSLAALIVGVIGLVLWAVFAIFPKQEFRIGLSLALIVLLAVANAWFFMNSDKIQMADSSYRERLEQNEISEAMLKAHPLGVGARQFTLAMENFSPRKLSPWEFQPVHNTYFLILNETGAQGLLLLMVLIVTVLYRLWQRGTALPLITLLLLAPFDHFLWGSFAGMMLVGLAAGFLQIQNRI